MIHNIFWIVWLS